MASGEPAAQQQRIRVGQQQQQVAGGGPLFSGPFGGSFGGPFGGPFGDKNVADRPIGGQVHGQYLQGHARAWLNRDAFHHRRDLDFRLLSRKRVVNNGQQLLVEGNQSCDAEVGPAANLDDRLLKGGDSAAVGQLNGHHRADTQRHRDHAQQGAQDVVPQRAEDEAAEESQSEVQSPRSKVVAGQCVRSDSGLWTLGIGLLTLDASVAHQQQAIGEGRGLAAVSGQDHGDSQLAAGASH